VSVGVGGAGGPAAAGSSVTARITGNIQTSGADSGGFLAQSVGGGGGAGGFDVSANISAAGGGALGVSVGVGGAGGGGGAGAGVLASQTGNITTGWRALDRLPRSVRGRWRRR
jgi:hypothetical protein